jgi:mono/diheme cytochrome c family protein
MHENLGLLRAIERFAIHGKLDDVKRFAAAIAEAPDEPGMGAWTANATLVRERAASLAASSTVTEACKREAKLAAACANCHVEAGALADLDHPPTAPPDEQTVDARMARHRWATDRISEAIVAGVDEPWLQGIDVLAATPLDWKSIDPTRAPFARMLQKRAATAKKATDRATAYGEILVICAGCHAAR